MMPLVASAPAPSPTCAACLRARLALTEVTRHPTNPFNPEERHLETVCIRGWCPACKRSGLVMFEVVRGWICP
jgi:hypothetical protein